MRISKQLTINQEYNSNNSKNTTYYKLSRIFVRFVQCSFTFKEKCKLQIFWGSSSTIDMKNQDYLSISFTSLNILHYRMIQKNHIGLEKGQ